MLSYVCASSRIARSGLFAAASEMSLCFIISNFGSIAENERNSYGDVKKPRSVAVAVAYRLLQGGGHRYLDVRTCDGFNAGHADGAVNIPFMFRIGGGMSKNSKFLEEVSSQFGRDDGIMVGCQSGRRSLMAATDLKSAGFTKVTDVAGGYSAWIEKGLPLANKHEE